MTPKMQIKISKLLLQAVYECGDQGAPSGIAYAGLMGVMDLANYQDMISMLVKAKLLTKKGHVLYLREDVKVAFDVAKAKSKEMTDGK